MSVVQVAGEVDQSHDRTDVVVVAHCKSFVEMQEAVYHNDHQDVALIFSLGSFVAVHRHVLMYWEEIEGDYKVHFRLAVALTML